jgi:hypothetical protein
MRKAPSVRRFDREPVAAARRWVKDQENYLLNCEAGLVAGTCEALAAVDVVD